MSSIAFNSALSSVRPLAGTAQPTQVNNTAATAAAAPASDTVTLSPTAQAAALQQQGLTINEIATNLGVTTATVDGYLDITTAVSSGGGGVPSGGGSHAGAAHAAAAGSSTTAAASSTATASKSAGAAGESSTAKAAPKQV
jgi:hypothetical protein